MFFELWKQIVKILSLSVQISFSRKKIFLEKCSHWYFFSERGRGGEEFFLEICGKNGVLVENGQEGYQNVTQRFQRDFLREDMYFRKIFPIKKSFQTFSIILVFCRFFEGLSKRPPRVQMKLLRKSFFEQKIVNDFFFRIWAEYCNTLTTQLQPIVKIALYLSRLLFSWSFFHLETSEQLNNFLRKSSGSFLQNFWKTIRTIVKKLQLDCQIWIAQIRRVFST